MTSPTDNSRVDDGGPAFPNTGNSNWDLRPEAGMSLRDWFAGQALASFNSAYRGPIGDAERAYHIADAMLAARKGGGQ